MSLSEEQLERYNRQILLSEVGIVGQKKLYEAKVLIIGVGGLGSPIAYYLAAAGIGTIGLADSDDVDLTNLHRQIIHFTDNLFLPKVISAKEKINQLNPEVNVVAHHLRVSTENIEKLIKEYDFIIDATDNFASKFLINDACVKNQKAFSHGGVLNFEGQTMTYIPGSACYRCIFKEEPEITNSELKARQAILGSIAGILGSIQATEALKYILNIGELLVNKLLTFNSLDMKFRVIEITKNDNCLVCS